MEKWKNTGNHAFLPGMGAASIRLLPEEEEEQHVEPAVLTI